MKVKTLVAFKEGKTIIPAGSEGFVIIGRVSYGNGEFETVINFKGKMGYYKRGQLEFIDYSPGEPDPALKKIVFGEDA